MPLKKHPNVFQLGNTTECEINYDRLQLIRRCPREIDRRRLLGITTKSRAQAARKSAFAEHAARGDFYWSMGNQ